MTSSGRLSRHHNSSAYRPASCVSRSERFAGISPGFSLHFHAGRVGLPILVMNQATKCDTPSGSGGPDMPSIGALSIAASGSICPSTSARVTRCPPIEWPTTICGPRVSVFQVFQRKARSSTQSEKSPTCPVIASSPKRPDPACPRQSAAVTCQPARLHSTRVSRYFS